MIIIIIIIIYSYSIEQLQTQTDGRTEGHAVNARRARLQLGLATVFERVYHLGL